MDFNRNSYKNIKQYTFIEYFSKIMLYSENLFNYNYIWKGRDYYEEKTINLI